MTGNKTSKFRVDGASENHDVMDMKWNVNLTWQTQTRHQTAVMYFVFLPQMAKEARALWVDCCSLTCTLASSQSIDSRAD